VIADAEDLIEAVAGEIPTSRMSNTANAETACTTIPRIPTLFDEVETIL
jgi:hypothetical protein